MTFWKLYSPHCPSLMRGPLLPSGGQAAAVQPHPRATQMQKTPLLPSPGQSALFPQDAVPGPSARATLTGREPFFLFPHFYSLFLFLLLQVRTPPFWPLHSGIAWGDCWHPAHDMGGLSLNCNPISPGLPAWISSLPSACQSDLLTHQRHGPPVKKKKKVELAPRRPAVSTSSKALECLFLSLCSSGSA